MFLKGFPSKRLNIIDDHSFFQIVGTKYVVRNVCSDRLRPLMSMPKDNAVCLDSWVGSTRNVAEKLVLK